MPKRKSKKTAKKVVAKKAPVKRASSKKKKKVEEVEEVVVPEEVQEEVVEEEDPEKAEESQVEEKPKEEKKKKFSFSFGKKKDDHNEGELNFDMMNAYLEADMFAGDESKVPIRGTPSLDEKQVSRDITGSLFKYYLSAEQNKELRKMQPIANAMKALATNNNITPLKEVLKAKSLTRAAKAQLKGEVNHRKEVITGMIEMLFEGKKLSSGSNEWATTKNYDCCYTTGIVTCKGSDID